MEKQYKTFNDLHFIKHPRAKETGIRGLAKMEFDNGLGISVLRETVSKAKLYYPYEAIVTKDNKTYVPDNFLSAISRNMSHAMVTKLMRAIQEVPKETWFDKIINFIMR